jgi:hypothetical protein
MNAPIANDDQKQDAGVNQAVATFSYPSWWKPATQGQAEGNRVMLRYAGGMLVLGALVSPLTYGSVAGFLFGMVFLFIYVAMLSIPFVVAGVVDAEM